MGLEGYFTDEQFLYNGIQNSCLLGIWIYGWKNIMVKIFFFNFKNFTDTKQSNYKWVVNDPHSAPTFGDIWRCIYTEDFTINGGVKIKL